MARILLRCFGMGLVFLLIFSLSACTQRAWFQGFVDGQRYQCNKLDRRERNACLESIDINYERYQRERMEHLQKAD